jgi:hypothetical protein
MKSKALLLLASLLLLLSGMVHAEGICPPGMYSTNPPGMPGPISCAPIPSYAQTPGQQGAPQTPQPPPERWQDHWGAIATDIPNKSVGTVTDMASQGVAEEMAIADCRSKGGVNCKIEIAYRNGCTALAAGDTGHNAKAGSNVNQASQAAMKVCSAADTHCQVYYAACSLPARIQ